MPLKESCPRSEVKGTALTMLRVTRISSLAPLRFTRVRDGVYRITNSKILYIGNILLGIIVILLTILTYLNMLQREKKQSEFVKTFLDVLLILLFATPIVLTTGLTILKGTSRTQNLLTILNQMQKVRRKIGYDCSLDPSTLTVIVTMVLPLILNSSLRIIRLYSSDFYEWRSNENIYFWLITFICHTVLVTMQVQYLFLAILLRLTAETLNQKLMRFTVQEGNMAVSRWNYKCLRNLYGSYILMWEIIGKMMQSEGLFLVMILYSLTSRTFITTYNLWRIYNRLDGLPIFMTMFVLEFLSMIKHIIYILLLLEPFHRLNREMEYTKVVMSRLLKSLSRYTAIYYELDNFYQQFILNLEAFNPLGLCHLSRSLIPTILGFLITFLTITNQFKFYTL